MISANELFRVVLALTTATASASATGSAIAEGAVPSQMQSGRSGSSNREFQVNFPQPKQLSADDFMSRLGDDYRQDWMSINDPSSRGNPQAASPTRNPPPQTTTQTAEPVDRELLNELRSLNFNYTDELGQQQYMKPYIRRIVERWLVQLATCKVRFKWQDMGVLFWPRWIKHGECDTGARSACSWPSGMYCAPAESDTLRLLHWSCRRMTSSETTRRGRDVRHRLGRRLAEAVSDIDYDDEDQRSRTGSSRSNNNRKQLRNTRYQCRWRKVPYPVTSECFCTC